MVSAVPTSEKVHVHTGEADLSESEFAKSSVLHTSVLPCKNTTDELFFVD